jgi:predicted permease
LELSVVFVAILTGLIPSFLMVILGGLVRKRLSENAWQGLDKLNFEILFPALLFVAASGRPIAVSQVASIAPLAWAILVAGLLFGYLARPFGPAKFLDFAGCWQTAWRFNTALGFVAIGALSGGDAAIFAVVVGMAVPMANVFAVAGLSRDGQLGLWGTLRRVALNPFLLASLGGVIVALTGLKIPAPVMAPLELLAQAAIPVALISIGATMNWGALARLDRFTGILNGTKLMVLPALVSGTALLTGAQGPLVQVLIVFAALPTASAAHVLAAGFGADRKMVATLIAQTTLLSAATLPIWILIAQTAF